MLDLNIKLTLTVGSDGHVKSPPREKPVRKAENPSTRPAGLTKADKGKDKTPKARKSNAKTPRDTLDNYHPRGIVVYIGVQECRECGGRVEYIAGELLQYMHRDKCSGIETIRTRAFNTTDGRYGWDRLPRYVERLSPDTVTCPSCQREADIFDAAFSKNGAGLQFPLEGF